MERAVNILTVRDVLRPGPREWVNAVVVLRVVGQLSDEEMGDVSDETPKGTVSLWANETVSFTWPIDNPVAAADVLEAVIVRARDSFSTAGLDAVPIEARLEVAPDSY